MLGTSKAKVMPQIGRFSLLREKKMVKMHQKATNIFFSDNFRCQDPNPTTGVVSTSFVEKADAVSEILPKIWGQSLESRDCIQEGLRLFYLIISSSSDTYSRPSCALMSFIDKVPSAMMEKAMETIIDPKESISTDEGQTVTGLQVCKLF